MQSTHLSCAVAALSAADRHALLQHGTLKTLHELFANHPRPPLPPWAAISLVFVLTCLVATVLSDTNSLVPQSRREYFSTSHAGIEDRRCPLPSGWKSWPMPPFEPLSPSLGTEMEWGRDTDGRELTGCDPVVDASLRAPQLSGHVFHLHPRRPWLTAPLLGGWWSLHRKPAQTVILATPSVAWQDSRHLVPTQGSLWCR